MKESFIVDSEGFIIDVELVDIHVEPSVIPRYELRAVDRLYGDNENIEFEEVLVSHVVTHPINGSFHVPRFNFEECVWYESLSDAEIETRLNPVKEPTETEMLGKMIVDLEIRLMEGGLL